jgi:hypothetical protein
MFNTYNHIGTVTNMFLSEAIKTAPVKGIDADPLVRELCEWICYETKGVTVFSCEGHDRPYSEGYVMISWPTMLSCPLVVSTLQAAIDTHLTPLKKKKQLSAFVAMAVDNRIGTSSDFTFRFKYKHNDRTFSMRAICRVLKQVMQDIDALDNPVTPVELDEEVDVNVSMYDLGA